MAHPSILHIGEHLLVHLTSEDLRAIERACQSVSCIIDDTTTCLQFCQSMKSHQIALVSIDCIITILENTSIELNEKFVLFLSDKNNLNMEKYKDKLRKIKFVIGRPLDGLFETLLSQIICFSRDKKNLNLFTK
jgi:hypothetical protein